MPCLRIKTGPNKGKVIDVGPDPVTIGRDESQTIPVVDQGVSRQHAEVFRIGTMVFVRDLQSTNGTFINQRRITEEPLNPGDELLIGTTIIAYESETPTETEGVALDDTDEIATTTVEIRVDAQEVSAKPGATQEVESRILTLGFEIGRILHSGKPGSTILQEALQKIATSVRAEGGFLFLLDRKSGKLLPKASVEEEGKGGQKVSRAIVRRVLSTARPVLTSDATMDERFSMSESVVLRKIRSVIGCPLFAGETLRGLLYFHSNRQGAGFSVADLELATAMSLQLTMLFTNVETSSRLRKGMISMVRALVTAMEMADPRDRGHAERVAGYGVAVATQMGLAPDDIHTLRLASLLHDTGKIAVHQTVPGATREQVREQHVYAGEKILQNIGEFSEILPIVRFHHERADGTGFPYRVTNDKIPVPARILIVTNAFDNICTRGGLQGEGLPANDVLRDMAEGAGKAYDETVVQALLQCHRSGSLYAAATPESGG